MRKITIEEIEQATGGKRIRSGREGAVVRVSTDSRRTEAGDLFVPIIGEVHDAHKFLPQVYERGCRTILVSDLKGTESFDCCNVILVDDTTKALQRLAAWYLETLNLKKVAVTGSVGKTTTRDMVYAILKSKYKTGTTAGNFNNDIGVPLTIFSFDPGLEACVLEVGMDHFGEIHRLVDIIRPDIGIITNVGVSHIENLGSRAGILRAKMEITDYFGKDHTLIINDDCDMLQTLGDDTAYTLIRAGKSQQSRYRVSDICDNGAAGISYLLHTGGKVYPVKLNVPGAHNGVNSALAIAAAERLGVSVSEAVDALGQLCLTGKRLTCTEKNGVTVIDDTYNAAPDSMESAIRTLMHTKGKRRVAILAGMNELGAESKTLHRRVGQFASEQGVDLLITVGEKAADIAEGFAGGKLHFARKEQLITQLADLIRTGDVILIKGSRTMEMEQITKHMLKEQE